MGALYLFDNGLAPYVSYSESFNPNAYSDASGTPLAPTEGKQWELGLKFQAPGSNSFYTASLFHITQENVASRNPRTTYTSVGEVRSQGLELEAHPSQRQLRNCSAATPAPTSPTPSRWTATRAIRRTRRPSTYGFAVGRLCLRRRPAQRSEHRAAALATSARPGRTRKTPCGCRTTPWSTRGSVTTSASSA
ncbi:TonB-dependent receptor [Pseudomonas aeruginosa]|nr:TonB-dependent receptor [Pseudomonas aeruginosa]